ncbi:DUF1816 domain-containing protein [Oscillatoria sp. CS-180]|uniref:DUF1816 domain-containing protein n=1 Tax=Oscillatoria sp. CS-180 TaxID=3021720 RepID=UPI00232C5687|nr:DUF1816 domain-containing protein [Oscillatoria sp. CS-180]MDB9526248.1 DUF1816 domain-containing protein [Oscillatoria sp. CS-180]
MKNILSQLFGSLFGSDKSWWLEIKTAGPACTYYFGPFDTEPEAELAKPGYVDDLQQEGAKVIAVIAIALSEPPEQLTVYEEGMDGVAPEPKPALSGQS